MYSWRSFVPKPSGFNSSTTCVRHPYLNVNSTEFVYFETFSQQTLWDKCQMNQQVFSLSSTSEAIPVSHIRMLEDTNYIQLCCLVQQSLCPNKETKNGGLLVAWMANIKSIVFVDYVKELSRNVNLLLLRLLHFTDNSTPRVHADPLHKIHIGLIFGHLKSNFKQ